MGQQQTGFVGYLMLTGWIRFSHCEPAFRALKLMAHVPHAMRAWYMLSVRVKMCCPTSQVALSRPTRTPETCSVVEDTVARGGRKKHIARRTATSTLRRAVRYLSSREAFVRFEGIRIGAGRSCSATCSNTALHSFSTDILEETGGGLTMTGRGEIV